MKDLKEVIRTVTRDLETLHEFELKFYKSDTSIVEESLYKIFFNALKPLSDKERSSVYRTLCVSFHPDKMNTSNGISINIINYFRECFQDKAILFRILTQAYEGANLKIYSLKEYTKYYFALRAFLLNNLNDTPLENIYNKSRITGGLAVTGLGLGMTIFPLMAIAFGGILVGSISNAIPGAEVDRVPRTNDTLTDMINGALQEPLSIALNPLGADPSALTSNKRNLMIVTYPARVMAGLASSSLTLLGLGSIGVISLSLAAGEIIYISALNIPAVAAKQRTSPVDTLKWHAKRMPGYLNTISNVLKENFDKAKDKLRLSLGEKEEILLIKWKDEGDNEGDNNNFNVVVNTSSKGFKKNLTVEIELIESPSDLEGSEPFNNIIVHEEKNATTQAFENSSAFKTKEDDPLPAFKLNEDCDSFEIIEDFITSQRKSPTSPN